MCRANASSPSLPSRQTQVTAPVDIASWYSRTATAIARSRFVHHFSNWSGHRPAHDPNVSVQCGGSPKHVHMSKVSMICSNAAVTSASGTSHSSTSGGRSHVAHNCCFQ